MSTLPEELLLEIFSWLPVKSLLRFRCLSKLFCELIYSPYFVKKHFDQSSKSGSLDSEVILTKDCRAFSLHFNLGGSKYANATEIYCPLKVSKLFETNSYFKESALNFESSSGGILCFKERGQRTILGITLWNPSTGQCRNVKLTSSCSTTTSFTLGYDPLEDDHKVLRASPEESSTKFKKTYYELEVYSLKKHSWKKINQNFPYDSWDWTAGGVSVHGALHWPASVCSDRDIIAVFDLGAETFREVPVPPEGHGNLTNLGDLGGRLCAFYLRDEGNREGRISLFVMQDYGIKESWTKFFTMETEYHPWQRWHPIAYFQDRGRAVLETDNLIFLYDPEKKPAADNIMLLGVPPDVLTFSRICVCRRSLIQLQRAYSLNF